MLDSILMFLDQGLLNFTWWQTLIYTLVVTHITIAAVTIYLHRCQAHRSLDLHPIVSHFFRFWLWLTTGMVTKEWAAVHRKHHAKCEQPEDPHSPQVFGIRKVLLEGTELYRIAAADAEQVEKYGHGTPDDWVERKIYTGLSYLGVYVTLVLNVMLFGVIGLSVFAIQMIWIPVTAAGIINGIGHFWGYRSFDSADSSANVAPWGIIIGGEELHNNHHAFPTSARLSNKWYEFDIGWFYICIMRAVGLATVKKVAPKPRFGAARPMVDLDNLQVVLNHRYDLMSAYATSLKKLCQDEARRLSAVQRPEGKKIAVARRWLAIDSTKWSDHHHASVTELFAASEPLRKLIEMRTELAGIWQRSNATREQLLTQLQSWSHRAEQSGVRALEELSVRLRSYAA